MWKLLLFLLFAGCAAKRAAYESYASPSAGWADDAPAEESLAATAAAPPRSEPEAPKADRMVHYEGFAELRVGRVQEAVDAVTALAVAAGGSLERQHGSTVVLRVPVDRFRDVFAAILEVGDVVRKSISAEDVTEAFTAVDLRLKTAQARRDRLVQLLAHASDENEKLALVREIQEVTEEIDRLEQSIRTLRALASYSRITVQLEQRPALTWQGGAPESAAFAWIRALSPFSRDLGGKRLAPGTPEGFVVLEPRRRFVAEAADGARIWAARLPNEPIGSTAFWTDALRERLGAEFARAEPTSIGEWSGLRLVDRSDTPYVWVVLVRAQGRNLDVAEVFYPSEAAEARHAAAVAAAVAGGAS